METLLSVWKQSMRRQQGLYALFVSYAAVSVTFCAFRGDRGEYDDAGQVGDHHEAAEGFGDVPGELGLHDGACQDDHGKGHTEGEAHQGA